MNVMTCSRQSGSRGDEIIDLISREFGLKLVNKESLEQDLVRFGLPEERVEQYDERKPGFWEAFSTDRDRYYHYLKASILETARQGDHIVVGRGSPVLLAGIPGILHLKIVAPLEDRIRRTMSKHGCDERNARKLLRESDHNRAGFYHFFFDADWNSAELYDLTCNTATLTPDQILRLVRALLESPEFRDYEATTRRLAEMATAQTILTRILFEERIPIRFPAVDVRGDTATISGAVNGAARVEQCKAVAESTEGISRVEILISDVPEIYVGPFV
jgi:cytidylate kinase